MGKYFTKNLFEENQLREFEKKNSALYSAKLSEQIDNEIYLKNMISSCFAYDGYNKQSYNYSRYIEPYKPKLGERLFEKIYSEQVAYLEKNYSVKRGTYTDSEGCTYNTLIKK